MIHAEKAQSMGYLRTGQVLQLMGKEEVALEIYKYGMQKVSVMDSNYKVPFAHLRFWFETGSDVVD